MGIKRSTKYLVSSITSVIIGLVVFTCIKDSNYICSLKLLFAFCMLFGMMLGFKGLGIKAEGD